MLKPVVVVVGVVAALSLLGASPAAATTFTVSTTDDEMVDDTDCSLREAINMASTNTAVGDNACSVGGAAGQATLDTIEIPVTPIQLDAPVGTDDNLDGDLDLLGPGGPLSITSTVAGDANAVLHAISDRALDKLPGNTGLLTLDGITVQNGNTTTQGANGEGGGIRIQSGDLTLTGGSIVQINAAAEQGGGIFVAAPGDLTILNSTVTNNSVVVPVGLTVNSGGGGIAAQIGTVTLTNATVSNNTVTRNQVGILGQEVEGGGVFVDQGDVVATNSTISGNQVNVGNSGPDQLHGGGIAADTVTIDRSTINDNVLTGGSGRDGGGVYIKDPSDPQIFTSRIHSSTFSNNDATAPGPGFGFGGAVYADGGDTVIRFTTFAFNDASSGKGDAVFFDDAEFTTSSFQYRTSLLFGGSCADDDAGAVGPEITSGGDNAYDTVTGCPFGSGDQNTPPLTLGALSTANGGPTATHSLPVNSPILNDISLTQCNNALNLSPSIPALDQRGLPRAVDGGCEPGSFEVMGCHGLAATIIGTNSVDFIPTTPANDVVVAGNNADTIQASAGNDTICADQGALDTIDYSTAPGGGPAVVDLVAGTATLPGKSDFVSGAEQVFGTAAGDTLMGTNDNGEMRGNGGNDILNGRGGQDFINGGADDGGIGDQIVFDNAPGNVTANLTDTVNFQNTGNGTKLINGVESIRGGPFNDQLTGDGAANTINGAGGTDTIHTAGGGDTVIGGAGADNLFGGAGDDFMNALDGEVDNVDCGDGSDTFDVDVTDVLVACESIAPPDADSDGVPDASDNCSAEPGPASNNGCPLPPTDSDSDGDGIPDASDACPTQAAPGTANGCPTDSTPPDTSAPQTKINKGPRGKIESDTATFKFSSTEQNSTFKCKLEVLDSGGKTAAAKARFKPCTSPKRLRNLAEGDYRFSVRATDAAGNTDATPAKRKFEVVGETKQ